MSFAGKAALITVLLFFPALFSFYPFWSVPSNGTQNISIMENDSDSVPESMFVAADRIYIADSGLHSVLEFTPGDPEVQFRELGSTFNFDEPVSVYADNTSTYVYVADRSNGLVKCWSCKVFYSYGHPGGITVFNKSIAFFTDDAQGSIVGVKFDGMPYSSFGRNGSFQYQFLRPHDITEHNGSFFIADTGNGRVEQYTTNFTYVSTFGVGLGGVNLQSPVGLYADDDYLYVADIDWGRVVAFTYDGYPVFMHEVYAPSDVAVFNGSVYVSMKTDARLEQFQDGLKQPIYYAQGAMLSMYYPFEKYSNMSDVADRLGIDYNKAAVKGWRDAMFAYSLGNYGEFYYKSMDANASADISNLTRTLNRSLYNAILGMSKPGAKDEVSGLLADGEYMNAYNYALTYKPSNSTLNATANVTQNVTNNSSQGGSNQTQTNASTNVSSGNQSAQPDMSVLDARLEGAKEIAAGCNLSYDFSKAESLIFLARLGDAESYNESLELLAQIQSEVDSKCAEISSAQAAISSLEGALAQADVLGDYSSPKSHLATAKAVVAYDPAKAKSEAELGLAEARAISGSSPGRFALPGGVLCIAALLIAAVAVLLIWRLVLRRLNKSAEDAPSEKKPPVAKPATAPKNYRKAPKPQKRPQKYNSRFRRGRR
jgi:hypothetical protein